MTDSTLIALQTPGSNISETFSWSNLPNKANYAFGPKTTPAEIVNRLLPFIFVIAGLILFAILISGGFTIFFSSGEPKKVQQGTKQITSAIIGFFIIFAAYWIVQILEFTLGIKVL